LPRAIRRPRPHPSGAPSRTGHRTGSAAPVSCPLRWDEVTARLDPARFTIKTAPGRFEKQGDPMAPVLGAGIDLAAALQRIESLKKR